MSTNLISPLRDGMNVLRRHGPHVLADEAKRYLRGMAYAPYWQYRYGIKPKHGFESARSTELPVFRDLFANLRKDDVFYDVGAYKGLFTLPVADILPPNRVVAFEPGEQAAAIESALEDAGLDATVVRKAISANRGSGYHSLNDGDRVGFLGDSAEHVELPSIDATGIIEDGTLPLPTVVKIDVYGAEVDVVAGLEELLARPECRLVYCELHLPTSFQRDRPDQVFEEFIGGWSFTDIVQTFFRCGLEVEPMYLRADTHDLFLKAYRPGTGVSD